MNTRIERLRALLRLIGNQCNHVETEGRRGRWRQPGLAREHDRLLTRWSSVAEALAEALAPTGRQAELDTELT